MESNHSIAKKCGVKKRFQPKWIKPFHSEKPTPLTFIVFDTETRPIVNGELTEHQLRYGYAQHVKKGELAGELEFTRKREFTKWLLNRLKKGHESLTVWGHNVSFDVRTALDFNYIATLNWNYLPISVKPFILKLSRRGQRITFLDTWSFFQTSLQNLGVKFSLPKLEINDFSVVDNDTLKRRCQRDVQITRKVVAYIYGVFRQRCSCSLPQLGFKLMRSTLEHPLECIKGLGEQSYYGGRCELFKRGLEPSATLLDFNSMHPSAMLNPLPIHKVDHQHNPSIKDLMSIIRSGYGVTAKVMVNVPECYVPPFALRRKDSRLIFPIGRFETVLNSPEIMLAPEYIEYASEMDVYRLTPFLQNFVHTYYQKRLNATSQIDKEFYKLLLNAVYGKFGQKIKVTKPVEDTYFMLPDPHFTGVVDYITLKGERVEYKIFNGKAYAQEVVGRAYSPAVSSFICSYARATLYKAMLKAGDDLIYCDTDSLVIRERALPWFQDDIGPELGQLKIEHTGAFIGYRPKMYRFAGKLKCKGVPRKANIIFDGKGAHTSFQRFIGLAEGMRRFHTSQVAQIFINKDISLEDDKRSWQGNESSPIRL